MAVVYLLFGGNQGDVPAAFVRAEAMLEKRGVRICSRSSLYRTQPWGEGMEQEQPFINQALKAETRLLPRPLLDLVHQVEQAGGRVRRKDDPSRTLDIDLLFYDDKIISMSGLEIPHPRIHLRKFVLQPLREIAPGLVHPALGVTIRELLAQTKDTLEVTRLAGKSGNLFFTRNQSTMRYNYIAIEGNIGAGKTSLATRIAKRYNGKLILEQFEENPFLAKFYEDQEKYAFPLELSFLADRYQQLKRELSQQDLFSDFTISDYFLNKSLIFARKTLNDDEFQLFRTLFNIMNANLPRPDLLVHLYVTTKRLQNNIRNRGRDYEQRISDDYLEKIQESYFNYLKQQPQLRILLLDMNAIDFVAYPSHLEMVLDAIGKDYPRGMTSISPGT